MFPVRRLGVYLDHVKPMNSYCPGFHIFAQGAHAQKLSRHIAIARHVLAFTKHVSPYEMQTSGFISRMCQRLQTILYG
jgi:hypothetical protein